MLSSFDWRGGGVYQNSAVGMPTARDAGLGVSRDLELLVKTVNKLVMIMGTKS